MKKDTKKTNKTVKTAKNVKKEVENKCTPNINAQKIDISKISLTTIFATVIAACLIITGIYALGESRGKKKALSEYEWLPTRININDELSKETIDKYESETKIVDESFTLDRFFTEEKSMVGVRFPNIDLETYNGETINLSKLEGKVVVEVVADWCGYCQDETASHLDNIVAQNGDVTFVQYMSTGGKDEVDSFYKQASHKMNDNIVVVLQNGDMDEWLQNNGLNSYPTFVYANNRKTIVAEPGEVDDVYFKTAKYLFMDSAIFGEKTNSGDTLLQLYKKQSRAIEFMNNTNKILVPTSIENKEAK